MNLMGANWQTTVSGIGSALFGFLTIMAALPYELGNVALLIPPEYKAKVVLLGSIATVILRVWNSIKQKDKNVTGGNVQQDALGQVAKPQEDTPAPPQAAIPDQPDDNSTAGAKTFRRPEED